MRTFTKGRCPRPFRDDHGTFETAAREFYEVAVEVSRGSAPDVFWDAFRMERMTALTKPDGGVRGTVVGDVFRRLIARTIAQEIGETVQSAAALYQYALKTRAGTECVSHILQTLVESDADATIVSIDGIGAFDLVSRNAMLRGLKEMDTGDRVLPFVRRFYGQPSLHIWEDEVGDVQDIPQGEGGDQGDPLMPLLFSLAMHPSLVRTGDLLREGEKLFAFLDDLYLICKPERVLEVFRLIENALWIHSRISVHCGKTQLWNRSGTTPRGCEALTRATRALNPDAVVWRGDHRLPVVQQGVVVLGSPVGHDEFIKANDEQGDGTPDASGTNTSGA